MKVPDDKTRRSDIVSWPEAVFDEVVPVHEPLDSDRVIEYTPLDVSMLVSELSYTFTVSDK